MILSVILKAIHVEVGWLMGLQHTLVALKFGQYDASGCGLVTVSLMCRALWLCNCQSDVSDFVVV